MVFWDYWNYWFLDQYYWFFGFRLPIILPIITNIIGIIGIIAILPILLVLLVLLVFDQYYCFFAILAIIWPIFHQYYWSELNYCYFTNIIGIIGISNNLAIILVNIGPMPEMTNNIGKIIGNSNNTNNIGKSSIYQ